MLISPNKMRETVFQAPEGVLLLLILYKKPLEAVETEHLPRDS